MPVSGGLFSVGLGSQTGGGIPTSAWNGDCYLEITVGGETLSSRELIRSVPIREIVWQSVTWRKIENEERNELLARSHSLVSEFVVVSPQRGAVR